MRCRFVEIGDCLYRCEVCGLTARTPRPTDPAKIFGACGDPPEPQPEVNFRRDLLRASVLGALEGKGDPAELEAAAARADQCLACPELAGTCCRRIEGPCSAKFGEWVEVIRSASCDRFR